MQYGGKDLSHFFGPDKLPLTRISVKGKIFPVFPAVLERSGSDFFGNTKLNWWQDPRYIIGRITKKVRKIRIINTLTGTCHKMRVCEEDTIKNIQKKYERYNWNQESYHWRRYDPASGLYEDLTVQNTLTDNGFYLDEYQEPHTPSLWLFFKDKTNNSE